MLDYTNYPIRMESDRDPAGQGEGDVWGRKTLELFSLLNHFWNTWKSSTKNLKRTLLREVKF